ncbi:phytanoyl-CoA dioxygenase family protein [Corynespora cassiicola Philippines]|uniref:Phytanoyl-CoA dioxygenase family protein n=1 Tax=Corynespora cassiicola Philippines TaxID=1448308 RepID=A0A2T2NXY2_CORCC|nr:phytanoyl-CoA dioxygenase family protein [Corynespora cassiicola Philippines]
MASYQVQYIDVPEEERNSRMPSAETVGAAVSIIHRDGIVVIRNVVDKPSIAKVNSVLIEQSERLSQDPSTHFNQDKAARNISQQPPTTPELMFDSIWANPFAASISAAILGPNPRVHYVNGNTALRSEERQTVHADLDHNHLRFPFALVANYYLTDTCPINGGTEVWVGSHRDTSIADHVESRDAPGGLSSIKPSLVKERMEQAPPVQISVNAGDLVLRDVRLWHAGMPNRTNNPRIMLAFLIFPWWYQAPMKIVLPAAAKPLLSRWTEETGLEFEVQWLEEGEKPAKFFVTTASANRQLVYG